MIDTLSLEGDGLAVGITQWRHGYRPQPFFREIKGFIHNGSVKGADPAGSQIFSRGGKDKVFQSYGTIHRGDAFSVGAVPGGIFIPGNDHHHGGFCKVGLIVTFSDLGFQFCIGDQEKFERLPVAGGRGHIDGLHDLPETFLRNGGIFIFADTSSFFDHIVKFHGFLLFFHTIHAKRDFATILK